MNRAHAAHSKAMQQQVAASRLTLGCSAAALASAPMQRQLAAGLLLGDSRGVTMHAHLTHHTMQAASSMPVQQVHKT